MSRMRSLEGQTEESCEEDSKDLLGLGGPRLIDYCSGYRIGTVDFRRQIIHNSIM